MRIVQPYASIIHFMGLPIEMREALDQGHYKACRRFGTEAVRFIEETGRVCYRSDGDMTETSYEAFVPKRVLNARHTSMLRFSCVVVDVFCDRGVAQEILRHLKTLDGQMESQRYCNYSKGKHGNSVKFVKPNGLTASQDGEWMTSMLKAELAYLKLLSEGCTPQIAADVLPRATACLVRLVGNFQAWRHFLLTRTTDACHPKLLDLTARPHCKEIEMPPLKDEVLVALPSLLEQFQQVFPLLFDDIVPFGKHVDNMMKAR